MNPQSTIMRQGWRLCQHCLGCLACWTLWLLLLVFLGFQIYAASTKTMPVPGFLLRSLEAQLSAAKISAQLGRTHFDPTGQIVIEDLRLSLPSFPEPVAQVCSLSIQLDPWALVARRFKPNKIRASGISLWVPAMLSASGIRESLVESAELYLNSDRHEWEIAQFNARAAPESSLGDLAVFIEGKLDTRPLLSKEVPRFSIAELFARYYPKLCRRLGELTPHSRSLRQTQLTLTLSPSIEAGALAHATLSGLGYGSSEHAAQVGTFLLETTFPLHSDTIVPVEIAAQAHSLAVASLVQTLDLRATLHGELDTQHLRLTPRIAELESRQFSISSVRASDLSLRLDFSTWPQLQGDALLRVGNAPLRLSAYFDLLEKNAVAYARGQLSSALLAGVSRSARLDIERFVRLSHPAEIDFKAQFEQATLTALEGRFDVRNIFAHGLTLDSLGGHIRLVGQRIEATHAYATIGSNTARGTYSHDLSTQDFRFLLEGQLNPPDIAPWFRPWWGQFWEKFDFSKAPPTASVDVQGRWLVPSHSRVFVYADSPSPIINGAALDQARTRIAIRPDYYDALEISISQGAQAARGSFLRQNDHETKQLVRQDFSFLSSLDLATVAALSGPEVAAAIAPFAFSEPIALEASGFVAASGARHIQLHGSTLGELTFYGFPLNGLNFTAALADDTLLVDSLFAGLAEGLVSGRLRLQGSGAEQQLGFDLSLSQGKFYQWTGLVSDYLAKRRGEEPPPHTEKNHNVTIDLDVSAEGRTSDPLSFIGSGNMDLRGRGLGQVHLFGLLSELLSFTALNFNRLLTDFSIEGDKIVFPEVNITGSNSAITASGHYSLERGGLDFRAKVSPFQESRSIIKSVVGLMLTPVTNALEVRLTGPLDQPKWNFLHFSNAAVETPDDLANPNAQ